MLKKYIVEWSDDSLKHVAVFEPEEADRVLNEAQENFPEDKWEKLPYDGGRAFSIVAR
jgi:hypothetical protein